MTFDLNGFARVSSSANEKSQIAYSYKTSADAIATVVGAGYFNDKIKVLAIGDIIFIEASDTHRLVRVTSVTTNVTVETYETHEGSLDLPEGNIFLGDGSGKASNLDASTDTQILVGNGTTLASVAMSGDATLANTGAITIATDAVTTAKILDANVTQAKIAPNSLDATVVKNVTLSSPIGGIPIYFEINVPGGSTANYDVTMTHKVRIVDAKVEVRGSGTAGDTITVQNGTNAIFNTFDISASVTQDILRATKLIDLYYEIAASGTLRVAVVDGGGGDVPECNVYIEAVRIA